MRGRGVGCVSECPLVYNTDFVTGGSSGKASLLGPHEKPIKLATEFEGSFKETPRQALRWLDVEPGLGRKTDSPDETLVDGWKKAEKAKP